MQTVYGWDVWYRIAGSDTPMRSLPNMSSGMKKTEEERERDILSTCAELEKQGYEIQKVERTESCARCTGTGHVYIRPKNWRKKTAPPFWAMRRVACPDCARTTEGA